MNAISGEVRAIELGEVSPPHLTVGGKAAHLQVMAAAGLPVPEGVVIPAEASAAELEGLAAVVAESLAGRRLAVRSSAEAEDTSTASFAGQYETVLDVAPEAAAIADAVRRVRGSARQEGVASYASRQSAAMAVLIMPMVDADAAGIAFTRDPVTGERVIVVEAVAGLGDRLAAGERRGESWRLGAELGRIDDLGVLTQDQARAVADVAARCEEIAGVPQDIEWAISSGEVVLLQARPITTIDDIEPIPMDDTPPPGPWEWDSTHNRRPFTPLTASVFAEGFARASRRLAETYGAPIKQLSMRTINGYLYIQVVPPLGKPGAPSPPKPVMRVLFSVVPVLRKRKAAARRAVRERVDRRLHREWLDSVAPRIEASIDGWLDLDISTLSDNRLRSLIGDAVELQRETFEWNMATDPAYLMPLADLNQFVEEQLDVGIATTIRLLAGASPSAYAASVSALAEEMPEEVRAAIVAGARIGDLENIDPVFVDAYRSHLRVHGLRVLGFDLSYRVLLEEPELELGRIATMPRLNDPTTEAEELAARLRGDLDGAAVPRFDALLAEARRTYPIREQGEAVHARAMGILRLGVLEAGSRMVDQGHLDDAEHVFFLTLDELLGWLRSPSDVSDTVRTRRGQHLWALGQSPRASYGGDAPLPDIDGFPEDVQRIMRVIELITTHDQHPADLAEGADGVAASPGVYTGPVRLVDGPEEFHKVQAGDVLVAPITMSPWEVLFPHIGALVTEGGGLLSHPAIVAREYGLPAVVGCEGAMHRFRDGQIVQVDGASGTVTPVEG